MKLMRGDEMIAEAPQIEWDEREQGWRLPGQVVVDVGREMVVVADAPTSVTRKQARKALVLAGMFDAVQPAIDAIVDPLQRQLVQIDWDDAQTYERDDPTLLALAAALGMDDAALDALFVQAATL